jgi:phosphatidylglycerophosphate synthase
MKKMHIQIPKARHFNLPNLLSGLRLLLVPIMWGLAFMDRSFDIGIGLMVAGMTDFLDGFIARRFSLSTMFGAKLDSLADDLIIVSVIIWVLMLRPEIVTHHPVLTFAGIGIYSLSMLISLLKFRRFGSNLHLYSHKSVAIIGYIFVVHAFLFGGYQQKLFYVTILMFILAHFEAIVIQLVRSEIDEHIGSIFSHPKRGKGS